MTRSESETLGEKLKAEIAEQTRIIMREMMAEFGREERQKKQEPPPPQLLPFDLDAEALGK